VQFTAIDLYDPIFQAPLPIPNLDEFDEIVFTSPSTVRAFLAIYGEIPKDKIIAPIGPITKMSL
jgi:uroporphyrinogen-III synthase